VIHADALASTAAAAADDDGGDVTGSSVQRAGSAGGDGISDSQRELVDIMQQVKNDRMTLHDAETFFYDWKLRHEGGYSRSFKQKQVSPSFMHAVYVSSVRMDATQFRQTSVVYDVVWVTDERVPYLHMKVGRRRSLGG